MVEIILGVSLAVVCLFLIVVLFYVKKNKTTTDELAVLEMQASNQSNKSNSNSEGAMTTRTRIGPGGVAPPTRTSVANDNHKYAKIIEILKECDAEDWETYLQAFKKEKLTDATLKLIPCDGGDDSEKFWKDLLPHLGIRLAFKKQWKEELKPIEKATPGGPGTIIKCAESAENVGLEEAKDNMVDTKDMDTAEPECEGNETKNDDAPAATQADEDGIDMIFDDDAALPAEPDNVVALQDEPPRPAYAAQSGPEPNFKRGVTYDYKGDNLAGGDSDSNGEDFYEPVDRPRGKTRGNDMYQE